MKHIYGIAVHLCQLGRLRLEEYDNGDDNEPHPEFIGSIGTRQVTVRQGLEVEVVISFDDCFRLFSADGVWIEISSGSPIGTLSVDESTPVWWIAKEKISSLDEFTFRDLIVWHPEIADRPTVRLPLVMPAPSADNYFNASHLWVVGDPMSLDKSSLQVTVARAKWNANPPLPVSRDRTEPPWTLRDQCDKDPRIIHREWGRQLMSDNGAPYIFEFRNMGEILWAGTGGSLFQVVGMEFIDDDRAQAPEEISDPSSRHSESGGEDETSCNDTEHENNIDDQDFDSADETYSDEGDFARLQEHQEDGARLEQDLSSQHRYGRGLRRSKRMYSYKSSTPSREREYTLLAKQPAGSSGLIYSIASKRSDCNQENQDDEEQLPRGNGIPFKAENSDQQSTQNQNPITPTSQSARSVRRSPSNDADLTAHRRKMTIPGHRQLSRRVIIHGPHEKSKTPGVPNLSSSANRQRMQQEKVDIDLTLLEDGVAMPIKQEPADANPPSQKGRAGTNAPEDNEEDEEDLGLQLMEIQIKRKLRAAKKRKLMDEKIGS